MTFLFVESNYLFSSILTFNVFIETIYFCFYSYFKTWFVFPGPKIDQTFVGFWWEGFFSFTFPKFKCKGAVMFSYASLRTSVFIPLSSGHFLSPTNWILSMFDNMEKVIQNLALPRNCSCKDSLFCLFSVLPQLKAIHALKFH